MGLINFWHFKNNTLQFRFILTNIVVILTDWWDDDTIIDKQQIQNLLGGKNIQFAVWWIWTLDWWKIVLWLDNFWRDVYKKYLC